MTDENGLATPFNDNLVLLAYVPLYSLTECRHTFLPSGIVERSTSTLAMASTSADADILTKKSAGH